MDANDFLMGGGIKSAAFPEKQYGTSVEGPILRPPVVRQQTDFDDGSPKFYSNGDPMQQVVVHVQTNERDPMDPSDDGTRAFYIKGQMQQAVRDAVRASGARGLEVGGHLRITYVRDEPNSRGRGKEKKIYQAAYRPPAVQAANDALMGVQPGPAVPPGMDPAVWMAIPAEQRAAIAAAMGQVQAAPASATQASPAQLGIMERLRAQQAQAGSRMPPRAPEHHGTSENIPF